MYKNWKKYAYRIGSLVCTLFLLTGLTACQNTEQSSKKNESTAVQNTVANRSGASDNIMTPSGSNNGNTAGVQAQAGNSAGSYLTQEEAAADQNFQVPDGYDTERAGVKYGYYMEHISYYSSTIQQDKEFAVLLPPGYIETQQYPVIYALHGFGGNQEEWQFIRTIYGNMIADGLAKPAIVVMPNMWTDQRTYEECDGYEQRAAYDNFQNDLANDLMPYVASRFPVKTGRENTAIIGLSQGGTESLGIGFLLQDRIGYIASLAPCPGVIPTEYYKDTFWNVPMMDDFVIQNSDTAPYYILLTVGSQDPWDIECTQYYDQVMTSKGINHAYDMIDGGNHDYSTWAPSFYNFAKRIFLQ